MILTTLRTLAALVLISLASSAHADFSGKVIGIVDGDTLDVLVVHEHIRVRLAEIDAPEKGQPFGNRAKQALAALAHGKHVTVVTSGKDRYGRAVGTVLAGPLNVNRAMVDQGFAWAFPKYLVDRSFLDVERSARNDKRGLWADPQPMAPWEWRAARKNRAEEGG